MDSNEDLSTRILLRNVLYTEAPRSPVTTRSASRAQAAAEQSSSRGPRHSARGLGRSDAGVVMPQEALKRNLKQKIRESTSRVSLPPSKRRTVSSGLRRTNTPGPSTASHSYNDDFTPRHLLRNIVRTEPEVSFLVQEKAVQKEPELPSANSSLNSNRPSTGLDLPDVNASSTVKGLRRKRPRRSLNITAFEKHLDEDVNMESEEAADDLSSLSSSVGSGLALPDLTPVNAASTVKGLRRRRPRRSLNITAFEKRLGDDVNMEAEEAADDHSSLSSSIGSATLSLKTPLVDIRTEKKGLQRKVAYRRRFNVETYGDAVRNREKDGYAEVCVKETRQASETARSEGFTLCLSDHTLPDITTDIITHNTILYAQTATMSSTPATQDKDTVTATHIQRELGDARDEAEGGSEPEEQMDVEGGQLIGEEATAQSQTEGEEAAESQTEEEEAAIVSQSQEGEAGVQSQYEEEEADVESQNEEEEADVESQNEEEDARAETQSEDGAAESQPEEQEEAAESQTTEEDETGKSLAEEEMVESVESQTEEDAAVVESQTEEEEDAAVVESQTEEEEDAAVVESQTEEDAAVVESQTEEDAAVESQTEEEDAAAVVESQTEEEDAAVVESQTEEEEEEEDAASNSQTEEKENAHDSQMDKAESPLPHYSEHISRRTFRSEGGLIVPATVEGGRGYKSMGAVPRGTEAGLADGEAEADCTGEWHSGPIHGSRESSQPHIGIPNSASSSPHGSTQEEASSDNEEQENYQAGDGSTSPLADPPAAQESSDQEEEWEDEDDEVNEVSMKTPAFVRQKTRFLLTDPLASPAVLENIQPSVSGERVPPAKPKKARAKRVGPAKKIPGLPKSYVMSTFRHFAKTKVSPDVYPVLQEILDKFFDRMALDLETYALHANRRTIEVEDVVLLLRRQGYVTDEVPVEVLIEKYLPMEYRKLLIPIATSGNVVIPKLKR